MIMAERECCHFLTFEFVAQPGMGPVIVRVTGPAGTKDFLKTVSSARILRGVGSSRTGALLRLGCIGESAVVSSRAETLLQERGRPRYPAKHQQNGTSHHERLRPVCNM